MKIPGVVWIILAIGAAWYLYQKGNATQQQAITDEEQAQAQADAQYVADGQAQQWTDVGSSLTVPLANAGATIIGSLTNLFTSSVGSGSDYSGD